MKFQIGAGGEIIEFWERNPGEENYNFFLQNCSNELGMILMENVFGEQNIETIPDWESCRFAKKSRHLILLDIVARIQHKHEVIVFVFYFCMSLSLISWQ